MKKEMKWGLATLLLLLGIAAVFIFLDQNAELRQLEKETAESDKLFEESKKQKKIEEANLPADDVKKPPPGETHETGYWHGDHWYKIVADELMVPRRIQNNTRHRRLLIGKHFLWKKDANDGQKHTAPNGGMTLLGTLNTGMFMTVKAKSAGTTGINLW